ncbi:MAG: alpha/beta fold hydrolase, partial [Dehalococcoidia bacterium]
MDIATWHQSRKFAETPYGRIAYVEQGAGHVALFFHGAFLNSYQWRDILPMCTDVRRCIAFDNLGHGHTEIADDQPLDLHTQAAATASLLDVLGVDAVDVVGNDTGGAIAQVFAATNPQRVRSLTLTNCDVHTNFPPAGFQQTVDAARAGVLRGALPRLLDLTAARSASGFGRTFQFPERLSEETLREYI